MLVAIVVILLFIMLGFTFYNGKGLSLIVGFNKETYNKSALGKFFGGVMFSCAFFILIMLLSGNYGIKWLSDTAMVLFVGTLIFTIIYPNTGNRFKK